MALASMKRTTDNDRNDNDNGNDLDHALQVLKHSRRTILATLIQRQDMTDAQTVAAVGMLRRIDYVINRPVPIDTILGRVADAIEYGASVVKKYR